MQKVRPNREERRCGIKTFCINGVKFLGAKKGELELTFLGYLFFFVENEAALLELRYNFLFHDARSLALSLSLALGFPQAAHFESSGKKAGKLAHWHLSAHIY